MPDADLRAAGLSGAKLASLRDLQAKVLDGTVAMDDAATLTDEEIVARLVTVRGIGRWTAEMYLMFELRRPDVWPVDDLGVRQGYGLVFGIDPPPPPAGSTRWATASAPTAPSPPATVGGGRAPPRLRRD